MIDQHERNVVCGRPAIEELLGRLLLSALTGSTKAPAEPDELAKTESGDGRPVIVRTSGAGVIFGDYHGRQGDTIFLQNARQLWRWETPKGGTLIDLATHGVGGSRSKFSVSVAEVTIFKAHALIECTAQAAHSISGLSSDGDWE